MKSIVIIDDEPLARLVIREYLGSYGDLLTFSECADGFEGIKAIRQYQPDLVFLDVQMPRINGFEMLEVIDEPPPVIFTTAFDEYAIKAFEHNALDYLLKPFSKERFDTALQKWFKQENTIPQKDLTGLLNHAGAPGANERIVVKNQGEISIIPVSDVVCIEAFDDYVKIFTKDNYYLKKKTMQYYENTLDPQKFFRTHRSFIINLQTLHRIEPMEKNSYAALLKGGKRVPLSRNNYGKLKEKLGI